MNLPNSCFFAVSPCLRSLKKRVPFCQSEDFVTLIGGWPRQAILAWVSKSVYQDVLMLLVFTLDQNAVHPEPIKRIVPGRPQIFRSRIQIDPFIFARNCAPTDLYDAICCHFLLSGFLSLSLTLANLFSSRSGKHNSIP